jgi:pSer/pThr/pTyr-binding forkhead associated (FHA) protein
MDVKLIVEKGTAQQQTWSLHHKDTVVGRRRDCDLRILSAEVSRRHCVLSIDGGYVYVEDLDSVNGTFVNGSLIVSRQGLWPGDNLEIGPLQFTVEYDPQDGQERGQPAPAIEVTDEHEAYDVLPLVRETSPSTQLEEDHDEQMPLVIGEDSDVADWHLPQTNDLRELLSQMEQSGSQPPRKR